MIIFQFEESFVVLRKGQKSVKLLKSTKIEVEVDEKDLKSAGAELSKVGQWGIRVHRWEIESRKRSIFNSSTLQ